MKLLIFRFSILICLILPSACSMGPAPVMPVTHDLGPISKSGMGQIPVIINAPDWLWSEKIRYRLLYRDKTAIAYYNIDRWEAPLPALLEQKLSIPMPDGETYLLKIDLTQFEQHFDKTDSARVLVALTARLFNQDNHQLVSEKAFAWSNETPTPDATGAINGFVSIIEQANHELNSWIAGLPTKISSANHPI